MNQIAKAAGISKNSSGLNATGKVATPLFAFAQAALAEALESSLYPVKAGCNKGGVANS
jgi:hypothetical protein